MALIGTAKKALAAIKPALDNAPLPTRN